MTIDPAEGFVKVASLYLLAIFPGAEGITLVPESGNRRFIKCGPILIIDTGVGTAPMEVFDVSELRKDHLNGKGNENRR